MGEPETKAEADARRAKTNEVLAGQDEARDDGSESERIALSSRERDGMVNEILDGITDRMKGMRIQAVPPVSTMQGDPPPHFITKPVPNSIPWVEFTMRRGGKLRTLFTNISHYHMVKHDDGEQDGTEVHLHNDAVWVKESLEVVEKAISNAQIMFSGSYHVVSRNTVTNNFDMQ